MRAISIKYLTILKMKYLLIIASSALLQMASSQILLGNGPGNLQNLNGIGLANTGMPINTNLLARNLPVGNLAANGLTNVNFVGNNLANTNLRPNLISSGNIVNTNFLGNNLAAAVSNSLAADNNLYTAGVPINLANGFNLNTGRFASTNTGLANILKLPCGLQIVGDRLEVGGSVGVNGQLPFYATVSAKGQLPSSGYGYASCGCGGQ